MTPPLESPQPQQTIVTIFAMYCRGDGESIAISDLITLMEACGSTSSAVRSAVSRLKKSGILVNRRDKGVTVYAPSARALAVFEEGDERIFAPRRAAQDDPWLLAAFSVPESQRNLRHRIRAILSHWGAGTVVPGVWILPDLHADRIREELEHENLLEHVDFFTARPWGTDELRSRIATWWDLPALAAHYEQFIESWQPHLSGADALRGEQAFVTHVTLTTQWRRLPYLDPGLPLDLLPSPWPAQRAADLMTMLTRTVGPHARDHVATVIGPRSHPRVTEGAV